MSVRKLTTILFLVVLSALNADIHFTESFENPDNWSTYVTGNVTFDSGIWGFVSVFPEASTASYDGVKACRINDDTAEASITAPAVNTVGTISFYYHKPFTGEGSFILQKSTDGGTTFVDLDTVDYGNATTPTFYSYNVNDISASVIMRILNDNNTAHLTIDYVTITDFYGVSSPVVNLSLSANAGTELEQTVITVTAATDSVVTGDQTIDVEVSGADIDMNDYVLSNTVITISDGTTSGNVTFTISDDSFFEGNEDAIIAITNPSMGLRLGTTTSDIVTIVDNETPVLPITENFESNTLGVFTEYSSASNRDWIVQYFDNNYHARMSGYQGDEYSDDWLISPAIDLSNSINPTIMFDNSTCYIGPALVLKVSTDYDGLSDPTTQGTWTALPFNLSTGNFNWVSSGAVNLSAYISASTYVAFHYTSDATGSSNWLIDNIEITDSNVVPTVNIALGLSSGSEQYMTSFGVSAYTDVSVSGDQTVDVVISGTNIDSNDYMLSSSTITIPDGATSGGVIFYVLDDAEWEGNETAVITLSNPSDGIILGSMINDNFIIRDNEVNDTTLIVTEDFESNTLGIFTSYSSASNADWSVMSNGSNHYARVNGFNADEASDDWLISPALDLSLAANPHMIFDNSMNYSGPDLELMISIDYDGFSDPNSQGTWITLPFNHSTGAYNWVSSGTVDLSSHISTSTYVAFHYTSTDTHSASWQIDDIQFFNILSVPTVSLDLSSNQGTEEYQSVLTISAVANASVTGDQTVDVLISGTNINSDDYHLSNTTITIPDGATSGSVAFTILDDPRCEGDETAIVTLSNPSDGIYLSLTSSGNIAIIDNDISDSTLIVSEDFESNTLGIFTSYSSASSRDWAANFYGGRYYARMDGFNADEDSNDWLISPALNLSFSSNPSVIFENSKNYAGPDVELKVSMDYDGFSDPTTQGTWTTLPFNQSIGAFNWVSSGTVDLSAFISPSTYIAFHYTSNDTGCASWEIDDIRIFNAVIAPAVNLELSSNSGSEEEETVITITANANMPVYGVTTLDVLVSGEDIDSDDYELSGTTITISNESNTGSVTLTILDDLEHEDPETLNVAISNFSMGIVPGQTVSGTITIADNDSLVATTPVLECFRTELHSVYPNPFNPETTIAYSLKSESNVSIEVLNVKGQKVKSIYRGFTPAGNHSVKWFGRNDENKRVGSGIYFVRMVTDNYREVRKIILLK